MDRQVINLIPVLAFVILAGLFAFNSNISIDTVHAEASGAQASLELDSVIDISAPNTVTLNCTPGATDASAELCTSNATVSITTNNVTGYTLQMNAASGSSNALTNTDIAPNATIPTLSQAYSSANFPINSWGYTGGLDKSGETGGYDCSTNYCPILAYESTAADYAPNHTIKQTDAPANNSTTTLTFAGKVNTTKPSGTYTTYITFTAVANAIPAQPISNGMDMQDIDSAVCGATPLYSVSNTIYTVVDSRDNNEYTVAKLADGNCWMLDNMRLDLTDSTVLNSLTTDNTNVDSASLISLKSGNRAADNRYASSGFATWNSNNTSNQYNQAKANADYKDTVAPTTYGNGSGKIGVYYNYCAASAGNYCYDENAGVNDTSTLQDAEYDICPKNWRMPTGSSSGEYNTLYIAYSSDAANFMNALSIPISGYFNSGSASLQGSYGYHWSSTWSTTTTMGRLLSVFSTGGVNPSSSDNRSYGIPVRCLIPGA